MRVELAAVVLAVARVPVSFGQSTSAPDLSGTWVDSANPAHTITLTEKDDTIQLHEKDGDKSLNYTCNLNGQQCKAKEDGHSADVMVYYNGNKLVEITERGSDVTKRRLSLSQNGQTMTMELIPLSSNSKPVTRTYQKQNTEVAKSSS